MKMPIPSFDETGMRAAPPALPPTGRASAPRLSVILLLSDSEPLSPEWLAERLATVNNGNGDVIVACSGRPANLAALQRTVDSVEFLLAPAGTSSEDLREMAMRRAAGDIIRLLDGLQRRDALAGVDMSMAAV